MGREVCAHEKIFLDGEADGRGEGALVDENVAFAKEVTLREGCQVERRTVLPKNERHQQKISWARHGRQGTVCLCGRLV